MDPRARAPLSLRRQGACRRSTLFSVPRIPTSVFPTLPTSCLQSVDAHSSVTGFRALPNSFTQPSLPQYPPNNPPIGHSWLPCPVRPLLLRTWRPAHSSHHVSTSGFAPSSLVFDSIPLYTWGLICCSSFSLCGFFCSESSY